MSARARRKLTRLYKQEIAAELIRYRMNGDSNAVRDANITYTDWIAFQKHGDVSKRMHFAIARYLHNSTLKRKSHAPISRD